MKKFDAIIIGFGKGGKTLAGFLANKGQNVAVIEKSDKMYGGTCINVGCIPSKSLVNSVERLENKDISTYEEKKNYFTKIVMNEMTMLDSKGSYGENGTSEPKAAEVNESKSEDDLQF